MAADLYDWLLSQSELATGTVSRVLLGLQWTLADVNGGTGLAFSPLDSPRTLPWPGTLAGRPVTELASWLRHKSAADAAVGLAVINAALNPGSPLLAQATVLTCAADPHLRVFEHFSEQVRGRKVVVVGRYPGLDRLWADLPYQCLERRPQAGDLPESAAPEVLAAADWVFITASSLANGTLPRLLEWSQNACVVLMGPSLPWLPGWRQLGVDYLAGVGVGSSSVLWQTVAEGGGTRIFGEGVEYRVAAL
ncbi:MAG: DUF364 domain-containing protein [Fluviicoccus sp.]|uniref:DUF364 domain-containing protein n=1 Tax=Fluviicoccus sp. TaxID=2003552 RepID=UPI002721A108|nr:DUF364 domain-containing protein [Fluviicoccus sp.]MDO8329482.1 DUF364 domain-containing protein [Fluviicoccus sp.]